MSAQVSMTKIVSGALAGVVKAQKNYVQWSGGDWLWNASEYMTTVFVAQEIAKLEGTKYVTLEHGVKSAMADAGAIGQGKLHKKIKVGGRFDILLWWADETPRAPIEVKCQVASIEKIKADLQRIEKVVLRKKTDSSFQFGMMVFYTSCNDNKQFSAKEILDKRLLNIEADCKQLIESCSVKMSRSKIYTDGVSAWVASAIVLKPHTD
jgi:hypothetical protein